MESFLHFEESWLVTNIRKGIQVSESYKVITRQLCTHRRGTRSEMRGICNFSEIEFLRDMEVSLQENRRSLTVNISPLCLAILFGQRILFNCVPCIPFVRDDKILHEYIQNRTRLWRIRLIEFFHVYVRRKRIFQVPASLSLFFSLLLSFLFNDATR